MSISFILLCVVFDLLDVRADVSPVVEGGIWGDGGRGRGQRRQLAAQELAAAGLEALVGAGLKKGKCKMIRSSFNHQD